MIRKIITIDEIKCNGCGLCAEACHEGAIAMVDGKAKLIRDDYCDGLGDCLPACPVNAITFVEREAAAYDKKAVERIQQKQQAFHGCFSSAPKQLNPKKATNKRMEVPSQLQQWPVQIKLVPVQAPYFKDASLLVAADCTAYAYSNFHQEFMQNKITIIGCPKLDAIDYTEKLTAILSQNAIQHVSVIRMEVPCCRGIEHAVHQAIQQSGKQIPCEIITISTTGELLP